MVAGFQATFMVLAAVTIFTAGAEAIVGGLLLVGSTAMLETWQWVLVLAAVELALSQVGPRGAAARWQPAGRALHVHTRMPALELTSPCPAALRRCPTWPR